MAAGVLLQADDARARRLGRDRARHDARLVGLPLEPAAERRSRAQAIRSARAAARPRIGCSAFRELGGFDEALFAYWEDVELALRFREAGWRCVLAQRRPGAARARADGRRRLSGRTTAGGVRPRLRAREVPRRRRRRLRRGEDRSARLAGARACTSLLRREAAPDPRAAPRPRARASRTPRSRAPLELATVGFGDRPRAGRRTSAAAPARRRAARALQRRCASAES